MHLLLLNHFQIKGVIPVARPSESEREALKQAAMAALPILAKLKEERTDLDKRIATFENVVAAYDESLGKRPRKTTEGQDDQKPKRGQVAEHIDAVLTAGGDYDEPELRKLIAQRFQVVYPRPTVYTALRRGRKAGKYEQKEKRWRMKGA